MKRSRKASTITAKVLFLKNLFQKRDNIDYLLLLFLILTISIANFVWVSRETRPPHWDMAGHLTNSLVYLSRFSITQFFEFLFTYRFYPPLVYWNAAVFYFFFGNSLITAVLSNFTFLTILTFATYFLGRELWGRRVGLLTSVFVLGTPMIVSQFKEFQMDAPLTAMVVLALLFLVKTKEFKEENWSIGFGLIFGLGLLTKWSFLFFLSSPTAVAVILVFRYSWKRKVFRRLRNLLLSFLLTYAVSGFWYLSNLRILRGDVASSLASGIKEGDPIVGSLQSNIFYISNLLNNQLYLIPFLFFVIGLIYLFRNRINLQKNIYPLSLIIGSILILSTLRNKDYRYTLPILTSAGILGTYWLEMVKENYRKVLIGILVIYSVLTFWSVSFGVSFLPKVVEYKINTSTTLTFFAQHGYLITQPTEENWYLEELILKIKNSKYSNKNLAFEGMDTIWFNAPSLNYFAARSNLKLIKEKNKAGFIVLRSQLQSNCETNFSQIQTFTLPDNSIVTLCARNL